jgi:hypothetical protein
MKTWLFQQRCGAHRHDPRWPHALPRLGRHVLRGADLANPSLWRRVSDVLND